MFNIFFLSFRNVCEGRSTDDCIRILAQLGNDYMRIISHLGNCPEAVSTPTISTTTETPSISK